MKNTGRKVDRQKVKQEVEMILKIKGNNQENAWSIRSDIVSISYKRVLQSEVSACCDRHFDSCKSNIAGSDPSWLQMLITFKNGKEEIWRTEVATYLLNDEGKTIERIN